MRNLIIRVQEIAIGTFCLSVKLQAEVEIEQAFCLRMIMDLKLTLQ